MHTYYRLLMHQIVSKHCLQLAHSTHGQEDVEDLMSVTHNVTSPWKEALRNWAREKQSRQHKKHHLQGVKHQHWLVPRSGDQAVRYRAYVEQVRQAGGNDLADLAAERVWTAVTEFGVAATGAGQPGQHRGTG